jgi:hypothetical protein
MGDCRARLGRNGLQVVRCFGAYDGLAHPQILVPLEAPPPARFFFSNILLPVTRFAVWMRPLAALLACLGLQRLLFRDLVIVARRLSPASPLLAPRSSEKNA